VTSPLSFMILPDDGESVSESLDAVFVGHSILSTSDAGMRIKAPIRKVLISPALIRARIAPSEHSQRAASVATVYGLSPIAIPLPPCRHNVPRLPKHELHHIRPA
jgi:hypothetical protein